jgi:hypothetical protein
VGAKPTSEQMRNCRRFHVQLAVALKRTRNPANLDRALIEHTAASFHFEQADHVSYYALGENNISSLLLEFGKYEDAHLHLDNAYKAFTRIGDQMKLATPRLPSTPNSPGSKNSVLSSTLFNSQRCILMLTNKLA